MSLLLFFIVWLFCCFVVFGLFLLEDIIAHVHTSKHADYYDSKETEHCDPVSNWMPYIVMNFGYYNGSNDNACKKSHFLGALGIFIFHSLPKDFSNHGLSHVKHFEKNQVKNFDLMSHVSNDFVWSSDCLILPNLNGSLLSHSIKKGEFATISGRNEIGCNVLIPHQHITFVTVKDTFCKDKTSPDNYYYHQENISDVNDSCLIGQWTEYSSCIFETAEFNKTANANGYQYRTRKLYMFVCFLCVFVFGGIWRTVLFLDNPLSFLICFCLFIREKSDDSDGDESNESDESESSEMNDNKNGHNCDSGCNDEKEYVENCQCQRASRHVTECSISNCLQIVMNGDRRSYYDNKWKLYDNENKFVASGRDDGYGSSEGCIIVEKGKCYRLHLFDRRGDGMCCDFGIGHVRWYFEQELLGFYKNNDNWYENIMDICIPDRGNDIYTDDYDDDDIENCVSVNITGDMDIERENFWNIYDSSGNIVMTSSKPHMIERRDCQCNLLPPGCYKLVVFDGSGDGLCCKLSTNLSRLVKINSFLCIYV